MISNLLLYDDLRIIIALLIGLPVIIVLFDEIINFVAEFTHSIVLSIKNKNIQTDKDELTHTFTENLIPKDNLNKTDGLTDLARQYAKKGTK